MPTVKPKRTKGVTHRVTVYQAPRQSNRAMREMLRHTNRELPAPVRPQKLATFTVEGAREGDVRKAIAKECERRGHPIRSLNKGLREYVVYTPHPSDKKDTNNAPPTTL